MDIHNRPALDLESLCRMAGVTERTVRYYIQRGLLPSPGQGPGPRYHQDYLDRLRVIRQLQRRHLPLEEIRAELDTMSSEAIARAANEGGAPMSSAAQYLAGVLDGGGAGSGTVGSPPRPRADRKESLSASAPEDALSNALRVPHAGQEGSGRPSSWDRYTLGDGIELHARRPGSRETQRRIERILAAARRIMDE